MAITESDRHHLLTALEHALGKEAAMTLAAHLPPVGWADVATKHDLDHLAEAIDWRFEAIDRRFEAMEHALDLRCEAMEHWFSGALSEMVATLRADAVAAQRTTFFGLIGALAANTALVLAVAG